MALREPLLPAAGAADARSRRSGGVAVLVESDAEQEEQYTGGRAGVGRPQSSSRGGADVDTFAVCAFNLAKVILGAGMMAFPKAMWMLGIVPGTALMVVIALMTYYTLARGLVANSDALGAKSYGALARATLGGRGEAVLQLAVFVTCWVMEVVFLVVIADVLVGEPPEFHGLIRELTGRAPPPRPAVLGVLCALGLLPLGSMRTMDALAGVNIGGVAANGVFAALMLALLAAAAARGAARSPPLWPRWGELVAARGGPGAAALCLASTVPIVLNCFACHQSVHPLLPSLRPYSTKRAQRVVATALSIAGVLYYIIAVCACAVFGPTLHDDILSDVGASAMAPILGSQLAAHAGALAVRIGYLLSLTGSFVLLLFPLRNVVADTFFSASDAQPPSGAPDAPRTGQDAKAAALQRHWVAVTAGLTGSAYLTACFLPSIWGALSLVGATATTVQAWIIPSLIILALEWRSSSSSVDASSALEQQQPPARGGGGAGAGAEPAWRVAARRALAVSILAVGVALFANAVVGAVLGQVS